MLLDVYSADPQFAQSSADCLANPLSDALVISPVTYVELAPAFEGNAKRQDQFLAEVGVEWPSPWVLRDTTNAPRLWVSRMEKKRSGSELKRPTADVFISAFAQRFQGLITRNPKHFESVRMVGS
jgi:predicted nucleic acid-binding protein